MMAIAASIVFQHTATRRWLIIETYALPLADDVSTHSHPKVADLAARTEFLTMPVSTHSHPKVAEIMLMPVDDELFVSTHSHPKVAD